MKVISAVVVLSVMLSGCANNGAIERNQAVISPDSSVLAFSINTEKVSKGDTWVDPKRLHLQYGDESITIHVKNASSGVQRYLLEVPGEEVTFTDFELTSGTGIFWRIYKSDVRQPIKLTKGEITYVGRIEILDVLLDQVAGESEYRPTEVEVVFTDAIADDLSAWQQQFRIFDGQTARAAVIGHWGGRDNLYVWSEASISQGAGRSFSEGSLIGTDGLPPIGAGRPNNKPPPTANPPR